MSVDSTSDPVIQELTALDASVAAVLKDRDSASRLLQLFPEKYEPRPLCHAAARSAGQIVPPRASIAAQLLVEGAGGGHEEIVRIALDRIDWPRADARWFG